MIRNYLDKWALKHTINSLTWVLDTIQIEKDNYKTCVEVLDILRFKLYAIQDNENY